MHTQKETDEVIKFELDNLIKQIKQLTEEVSEISGDLSDYHEQNTYADFVAAVEDALLEIE